MTAGRESLCVAVTAGAGINLVTSVGASGVDSDSVVGVTQLADGCDVSFFCAVNAVARLLTICCAGWVKVNCKTITEFVSAFFRFGIGDITVVALGYE